jgi:hypothetical protein
LVVRGLCAIVCAAFLTGCAAAAAPGRVGYIDLTRLIREHPLYAQLVHYDRAIGALRSTQEAWSADSRGAEIAQDRRSVAHSIDDAETAMLEASRSDAAPFAERERSALDSLNAMPRPAFTIQPPQPGADLAQYRNDLLSEEQHEIAQVQAAMARRVQDAYEERSTQLRESASRLAFDLARQDAHQILLLRVRLDDLQLGKEDRQAAETQLERIARDQSAQIAARTARNDRTLHAYAQQISRNTRDEEAATIAQIRERIAANYAARVQEQRAQGPLPARSTGSSLASESLQTEIQSLEATSGTALESQAASTHRSFAEVRSAASARTSKILALDRTSASGLAAQISALARQREALLAAIEVWIERDAHRVAQSRGIASIETGRRPPGSVDLTNLVQASLRSALSTGP